MQISLYSFRVWSWSGNWGDRAPLVTGEYIHVALGVVLRCVGAGSGDEAVTRGAQRRVQWGSWGDAAYSSPSLCALEKFQLLAWGFGALGGCQAS